MQRCEYCLIHTEDVFLPHEVDHIIAKKHGGQTAEDNLALACFLCNRFKGADLASVDPATGNVIRLFHPRKDRWSDHFRVEGAVIIPLTPEGDVTTRLLQFNRSESVELRKFLISSGRYPS